MSRLLFEVVKRADTNHLLSIYLIKTCNQKAGHSRPRKEEGCVMFFFVLGKKNGMYERITTMLLLSNANSTILTVEMIVGIYKQNRKSFKPFELFPKLMKQVKYTINPISLFVKHNFSVYIQL